MLDKLIERNLKLAVFFRTMLDVLDKKAFDDASGVP
jgi:hypothetical protein